MRKTLGQVSYVRAEQTFADPEKEASRREVLLKWRRKQLGLKAVDHIKRIVREDGLARSVEELHDREGRPPANVDLERMVKQYKRLKRQNSWLNATIESYRDILREIDLVRFIKDSAQIEQDLIDRKAEREKGFREIAARETGEKKIPPKLAAMIKEEIKREIRRKEIGNMRGDPTGAYYISLSRRVQEVMIYLFLEYVPEEKAKDIDDDADHRYRFIFDALWEIELLGEDLRRNLYDLQEFIESADLVVMKHE